MTFSDKELRQKLALIEDFSKVKILIDPKSYLVARYLYDEGHSSWPQDTFYGVKVEIVPTTKRTLEIYAIQ